MKKKSLITFLLLGSFVGGIAGCNPTETTSTAGTRNAVTQVAPSLSRSTLSAQNTFLKKDQTTLVSLTTKDDVGLQLARGHLKVKFSLETGVGKTEGIFAPVFDRNDGVYLSTLKITKKGTATFLRAEVEGYGFINQKISIEGENSAPVITFAPSSNGFLLDGAQPALPALQPLVLEVSAIDQDGDVLNFDCAVSGLDDLSIGAGTSCSALPSVVELGASGEKNGFANFDSTLGKLNWTPTKNMKGRYQFTVSASDGSGTVSRTFVVTVREPFTRTYLLGAWEFGRGLAASTWTSLIGGLTGVFSKAPTMGADGIELGPTQGNLNLGNVVSAATRMLFHTWIKPADITQAKRVILSTSNAPGIGFQLEQASEAGKLTFSSGFPSYVSEVLADNPEAYWRMDESGGSTYFDSSGKGRHAQVSIQYSRGPTFQVPGAIGDGNPGVTLGGQSQLYYYPFPYKNKGLTLETWVKLNVHNGAWQGLFVNGNANYGISYRMAINPSTRGVQLAVRSNADWTITTSASSAPLDTNAWYHVVGVYDGSYLRIYLNGVEQGSGTPFTADILNPSWAVEFSLGTTNSWFADAIQGVMDDAAIYHSALSSSRILAHYNAGLAWNCKTQSTMSNGQWAMISGLFEGNRASLFVNGKKECDLPIQPAYAPGATALQVGSRPNQADAWSGTVSDLKFYGTTNGRSPGTGVSVQQDFEATANRYRVIPIENIVSSHLYFHWDVANAKAGLRPQNSGCPSGNFSFDLSLLHSDMVASGYSSCGATEGWQGSGTPAAPHYFGTSSSGGDRYVEIAKGSDLNNLQNGDYSIEAWVSPKSIPAGTDTNTSDYALVMKAGWHMGLTYNAAKRFTMTHWLTGDVYKGIASATQFNPNQFHQVVGVVSKQTGTMKLYVDGKLEGSTTFAPNTAVRNYGIEPWRMGVAYPGGASYRWASDVKFGVVRLYGQALTQDQVKQNCEAQKARFSGLVCEP